MNKFFLLTLFLFISQKIFSQEINKTITVESLNKEILIGLCDKKGLEKINFKNDYILSQKEIRILSKINRKYANKNIEFIVFIGSWCSDTQLHLPVFLTFYEKLKTDKKLKMLALDLKKQSPENEEVEYQITHVPTFIVLYNGNEIGRIIESPKKGILEDILKIFKQIQ